MKAGKVDTESGSHEKTVRDGVETNSSSAHGREEHPVKTTENFKTSWLKLRAVATSAAAPTVEISVWLFSAVFSPQSQWRKGWGKGAE